MAAEVTESSADRGMQRVRVRSRLATLLIMVAGPSSTRGKTLVIRRAGGAFLTVLLILIDSRFIPGVYAAKAAIRLERLWEIPSLISR